IQSVGDVLAENLVPRATPHNVNRLKRPPQKTPQPLVDFSVPQRQATRGLRCSSLSLYSLTISILNRSTSPTDLRVFRIFFAILSVLPVFV
nr:hypothetical protein [Candidatus Freyarchaeota archaeon]